MLVNRLVHSLVALLLIAAASAAAPSAVFHTRLARTEPAANDTVLSPVALHLWFSERVELPMTRVTLTNAAGEKQTLGPMVFADQTAKSPIVVGVTGKLTPGNYRVTWGTAAKDGHPAKGKFGFVVKAGP